MSNKNKYLPTSLIIRQARARGYDFGSTDPTHRLRYFIKIGILPHMKRWQSKKGLAYTEGFMPQYTVDLLLKIQILKRAGKSISEIAPILSQELSKLEQIEGIQKISKSIIIPLFPGKKLVIPYPFAYAAGLIPFLLLIILFVFLFFQNYINNSINNSLTQLPLELVSPVPTEEFGEVAGTKTDMTPLEETEESTKQAPISKKKFLNTANNLLRNSSFEIPGSGQPRFWNYQLDSTSSNTYSSAEGIRSGGYGLKFQSTQRERGYRGISQPETKTVPGKTYSLSAYLKGTNISPNTILRLGFWDEHNNRYAKMSEKKLGFTTRDWTRISMTTTTSGLITDSKNWFPIIEIVDLTQGIIYLDDLMLEEIEDTEKTIGKENLKVSVYDSTYVNKQILGHGGVIAEGGGNLYPSLSSYGSLGTLANKWDDLYLSGAAEIGEGLSVGGNTSISGNLGVNGDKITADNPLTIDASGYVRIGGDTDTTPTNASSNDDLYVQGDLEIDGHTYLEGDITITGTQIFTGNQTLTGNLVPGTNNTYDLGSSSSRWRTGYLGTSLNLEISKTSGNIIGLDWGAATTQTSALSGLDIDFSNLTSVAGSTTYGLHINDLSAQTSSTEYAIYQQGTNWDYGGYFEDNVYIGGTLTGSGSGVFGYWTRSGTTLSPATTNDILSLTSSSGVPLTITNTSASNSFLVNDEASDTSPFVIDTIGNVGIGDTAPAGKLEVAQTDAANDEALIIDTEESTSTQNVFSIISDVGSGETTVFNIDADGSITNVGSNITGTGALTIASAGSGALTLDSDSGNLTLGSGTNTLVNTDASTALTIKPTGDINLAPDSETDDYLTLSSDGSNLTMGTAGSANLTIDTGGTLTLSDVVAFSNNPSINKADPSIILDTLTATDTDFWLGIQEDAGGDDDDKFQIGDGTTPGTNPFLTIDTSGNVGIGTTSPSTKLHLASNTGAVPSIDQDTDFIISETSSSTNQAGMSLIGGTSGYSYLWFGDSGQESIGRIQYHHSTDSMWFYTNLTEQMRITSGGNVGIGEATPAAKLEVAQTDASNDEALIIDTEESTSTQNLFSLISDVGGDETTVWNIDADGSLTNNLTLIKADPSLVLNVTTATDTDFWLGVQDDAEGDDDDKFQIGDGTTPGTNPFLTIDTSGQVGIGATSPDQALDVVGTIQASNLLGGAINITADANGNIIRDPSDINLKENISQIDNALEKILALNGVYYNWKDKERFGTQQEIGLLAQEVEPIVPQIVRDGPEYKSVNYKNLTALLVEGIKEQQEKISDNGLKIDNLETQLASNKTLMQLTNGILEVNSAEIKQATINSLILNNLSSVWDFDTSISPEEKDYLKDGSLVSLADNGKATISQQAYNPLTLGVYQEGKVIFEGTTTVSISTSSSSIKIGDILTTSNEAGQAQKAEKAGYSVGRALESWQAKQGQQQIKVLLSLGYSPEVDQVETNIALETNEEPASESASLAALINSNPEDLELKNLIINENMNVLGTTTVSDLGITGTLTTGFITVDGIEDRISSLNGPLKIGGVDKLVLNAEGDIEVNGKVTAQKYNIKKSDPAVASAGKATLPIGQISVTIETSALNQDSLIFVTPERPVTVGSRWVSEGKFEISTKEILEENLLINWWIVN